MQHVDGLDEGFEGLAEQHPPLAQHAEGARADQDGGEQQEEVEPHFGVDVLTCHRVVPEACRKACKERRAGHEAIGHKDPVTGAKKDDLVVEIADP